MIGLVDTQEQVNQPLLTWCAGSMMWMKVE